MPCPSDTFSGFRAEPYRFVNWVGTVDIPVAMYFEPDSLGALVWVVKQAREEGHRIKVAGSRWSYENIAACPDWMVSLRQLNHIITSFEDEALTADSPLTIEWQRRIMDTRTSTRLVHVQGGMELIDLNTQLHGRGLAMPTLGGSQGQTIAGAINTGTHGSDIGITPVADIVRAVHLVTNDGQEIWVEAASNPVTTDEGLRSKLECADVQVVRDDDLLRALQVSVGRFGIIYSYILEIRTRFDLSEWAVQSTWADVSRQLREGLAAGGRFGPLIDALPPPTGAVREDIDFAVGDSDINPRPRFLEFLINSRNPNQLYVRRRWPLTTRMDLAVPGDPVVESIDQNHAANWILKAAASVIRLQIPTVAWILGYGIGRALYMEARAIELDAFAHDPNIRSNFALVAAMNALWACDEWHAFGVVIDMLVDSTFSSRPQIKDGLAGKRGVSWQIMAGLSGDPGDIKVNSIEIVFDATNTNYIDFIDILAHEGHGYQQSGYISVRYSRKSEAFLSMHNVDGDMAVSIEVVSLVGFAQNDRWMRFVEARGIELGGRPHWGQQNNLQAFEVMRLYGSKATSWREQLVRIVGVSPQFSNDYTDQRGLEPFAITRMVTHVRRERGRTTHLVNPGEYWSPIPVEEVIRAYESDHVIEVGSSLMPRGVGRINYQTRPADETIPPGNIIVTHVLMTEADDTPLNNLRSLPLARELYLDLPPPESTRRRVTSVVRNRGGGVTHLCNDVERWRISDAMVFYDISRRGIEYYVDRGGLAANLVTRTNLATFADGIVGNNLDSLPNE